MDSRQPTATRVRRQALTLALLTILYNLVEGGLALYAARRAGSNALLGFGLDSLIESLSGGVILWRFWKYAADEEVEEFEALEAKAAQWIAYSFFLLGGYVILDAGWALARQEAPAPSPLGIGLAVASLIVMPLLFLLKYRLGRAINSPSLIADAKETLACVMLSVALLIGLVAFAWWRWWWVDSAAALLIAALLIREGRETLAESRH